jgi:hypothetical protein
MIESALLRTREIYIQTVAINDASIGLDASFHLLLPARRISSLLATNKRGSKLGKCSLPIGRRIKKQGDQRGESESEARLDELRRVWRKTARMGRKCL